MKRRIEAWVRNSSPRTVEPTVTQLHYNGAPWMARPHEHDRWSYHTLIGTDGARMRMVDYNREAWHSGVGEILINGEMRGLPNRFTIGVAFQNCGLVHRVEGQFYFRAGGKMHPYPDDLPEPRLGRLDFDDGHSVMGYWQPYTEEQVSALVDELDEIAQDGYEQAAGTLCGHEDTSMPLGNKIDPGPLFPWNLFAGRLNPRTVGVRL